MSQTRHRIQRGVFLCIFTKSPSLVPYREDCLAKVKSANINSILLNSRSTLGKIDSHYTKIWNKAALRKRIMDIVFLYKLPSGTLRFPNLAESPGIGDPANDISFITPQKEIAITPQNLG